MKLKHQVQSRAICIGECMLEFSERSPASFKLGFAGDTFNTAWYLRARLGPQWQVDYLTAIGDDHYSAKMVAFMQANNIGTDHIRKIPNRSPGLYVIRQAGGDRYFTYWRGQSAAKHLADNAKLLQHAIANSDLIYFSGITLAILSPTNRKRLFTTLKRAKKNGTTIAFDPNERPALWEKPKVMRQAIEQAAAIATFVFPTFQDEQIHFKDKTPTATALRYLTLGVSEVVVKNGPLPALVASGTQRLEIAPAKNVKSIDPTGAGDSFNGAYLAARLNGAGPEEAATMAHKVAGTVIAYPGALVPMKKVK